MTPIAKMLIIAGIAIALFGTLLLFIDKIPWLGRLPGDIYIQRKNFNFYFPITTCILVSIVLSLIIYLFTRR